MEFGAAVLTPDGSRRWVTFTDTATNSDDFDQLGTSFDQTGHPHQGRVGKATCRLFSLREAVAHALTWLPLNRKSP